jgi:exopolyphosphatase/guanosine-5'-triphosphate,3'-diphosphate pyrophosphatase
MVETHFPYEFAVIELGSNTARLAIFAYDKDGTLRRLHEYDETERLRLIDELDADGKLPAAAVDQIVTILGSFRAACKSARMNPDHIAIVATSALRVAANRTQVLDEIRERTHLQVRVLSAEEEAKYACQAIVHALGLKSGLVFDLGGAGLQVARVTNGQMARHASMPLGPLRLLHRFPNYAPMTSGQLEALRLFVATRFAEQSWMREAAKRGSFAGIGGTVRTLARIEQAANNQQVPLRGYTLKADHLEGWVKKLSAMTPVQLREVPGLQPDRADMALFGAILARELMSAAGAKSLIVADVSIREGIAFELCSATSPNSQPIA